MRAVTSQALIYAGVLVTVAVVCGHDDYSLSEAFCDGAHAFLVFFFFFNDTATTEIYTLSLHDALPISTPSASPSARRRRSAAWPSWRSRSEEHTSELQSRRDLVCRLLLEKKKKTI